MANLSIPSIRERLFNTSKHEQVTSRNSSNPFAQVSFKGNVLTADVFESSDTKEKQENKIGITGKLKASALVGSISGFGRKFHNMIESAISFGNRVKESAVNGWNRLNEIEISLAPAKEGITSAYNSAKNWLSKDMTELLSSGISAKAVSKMDDMTALRQLMSDNVALYEAAV